MIGLLHIMIGLLCITRGGMIHDTSEGIISNHPIILFFFVEKAVVFKAMYQRL